MVRSGDSSRGVAAANLVRLELGSADALNGRCIPTEMTGRLALRILILALCVYTAYLPLLIKTGVLRVPMALLMQVIVFSILVIMSLLGVYVSLAQQEEDTAAASKKCAQIESLYPAFSVAKQRGAPWDGASAETCVVCLEETCPGDACRRLRCGHAFHARCIDAWWLSSRSSMFMCPLCRGSAVAPLDKAV